MENNIEDKEVSVKLEPAVQLEVDLGEVDFGKKETPAPEPKKDEFDIDTAKQAVSVLSQQLEAKKGKLLRHSGPNRLRKPLLLSRQNAQNLTLLKRKTTNLRPSLMQWHLLNVMLKCFKVNMPPGLSREIIRVLRKFSVKWLRLNPDLANFRMAKMR
jgi:hypothetical protein